MKRLAGIPDTVVVFCIFFLFFALNLTSNFSGPHDSMGYLNEIEKHKDLFPAAHLLYHYIAFLLFHLLHWIFGGVRDYFLVEIVDTIWGCLGLTVVYRIFLLRMKMTRTEAFLGTCVAAFSFGMWFYCSNIEVYMPSTFFLLLGLFLCMKDDLTNKDVTLITLVHCLAVLFHESNVLFAPVVLWKFWDSRRTIRFWPSFFRYTITSVILVAGVYILLGTLAAGNHTFVTFMAWLRGDTAAGDYWFPLSFNTLIKAFIGFGHAIFGAHFVFRVGFLERFMDRLFFYHNLDDEAFLVRNLSPGLAAFLLALATLVTAFMVVGFLRVVFHLRSLYRQHRRLLVPPALFLVIYSAFFFFWMPENLEFWIPQSVVFWILVLGLNKQLPPFPLFRRNYFLYGTLAALLFFVNYWGSIHWMKDINNDSVYVKIRKVKDMATNKDLIILEDPWLLDEFLQHFTPSTVSPVPDDPAAVQALDKKVDSTLKTGGRIYVFAEKGSLKHSSKNIHYADSLLNATPGHVTDLHNDLTTVRVISR
jgi:hypothetical protein